MDSLETRYRATLRRISEACARAGREDLPTLLAVSKTHGADRVEALYRLGQRDFAENYAQELVEKAGELARRGCAEIRWHFIGHLQTNKVKVILPIVRSVHTVDSERLAQELSKRQQALANAPVLDVFLEVNIDGEASKSGLAPEAVRSLAEQVARLPGLRVRGLMCVPAPGGSPSAFKRMQGLRDGLGSLTGGSLSMGMSADLEDAVAAGATHIRIGTALFGERGA